MINRDSLFQGPYLECFGIQSLIHPTMCKRYSTLIHSNIRSSIEQCIDIYVYLTIVVYVHIDRLFQLTKLFNLRLQINPH